MLIYSYILYIYISIYVKILMKALFVWCLIHDGSLMVPDSWCLGFTVDWHENNRFQATDPSLIRTWDIRPTSFLGRVHESLVVDGWFHVFVLKISTLWLGTPKKRLKQSELQLAPHDLLWNMDILIAPNSSLHSSIKQVFAWRHLHQIFHYSGMA